MLRVQLDASVKLDEAKRAADAGLAVDTLGDRLRAELEALGVATVERLAISVGPDPDEEGYGAWAQGEVTDAFRSAQGNTSGP